MLKKVGANVKSEFETATDSKHTLPVAGNLLNQRFEAFSPNTAWVSRLPDSEITGFWSRSQIRQYLLRTEIGNKINFFRKILKWGW